MSANSNARNKHSKHDNPIDITKEEFSRISDAFKKEEFRKLFFEYVEEIQDPENRKIYEAELKQFEAERGVDLKFINPEPGFVVKTSIDGVLKCFVNVASNADVAKPSNEVCMNPETGKRGISWAIPMAQAPPRDDIDAHGKRCRVFDVVFHPDALYLAQRNGAFRKCLIDTALDAVEREYKAKLDRVNLKFPKLQYKGMARPTVIRKLSKNPPPEAKEPHPLDNVSPAKPTEESAKPKILPMTTMATKPPAAEFSTPTYVIKHRRDVDLAEYTDELDSKLNVTMPRELVIEIELPLLNSTADCQLDVMPKTLYLLSERAGAKYRLSLNLPYVVDDKNGTARFDTDKRCLSITLPVLQQSVAKQRDMHETLLHLNREDSGVESDMREELNSNSNSESPVEELSDSIEDDNEEEEDDDDDDITTKECSEEALNALPSKTTFTSETFLKNSIHYQFPAKFDCNVLDNIMSLVLHVRNVQSDSIAILQQSKSVHLQFTSIGSGYYPTHYAYYLQLPQDTAVDIVGANAIAWENNIVLDVQLSASSELIQRYWVGLDAKDLKEFSMRGKLQLTHNSRHRQRKRSPITPPISLSSSLDISIERSECERSVEIEIKPHEQHSTAAANTTEDEEMQRGGDAEPAQKKLSKKQRKKNKKRRSLSESACDDLKAYHQQQQQQMQQQQQQQQTLKTSVNTNAKAKSANDDDDDDDDFSSPERMDDDNVSAKKASCFVAVPISGTTQQRKQRSYSECRSGESAISCSSVGSSTLPPSFKGILKRYSRYEPRPSISDSCSSIDECSSLYSCSMDAGMPHSLRFSQSFSDIPEENVTAEMSESCKKTVRFNEVIMKQVFRLDSSILGQRKKNQKRRDRKLRALQRRLSEGDSADYEDNNKPLQTDIQYFKSKGNHNNANNKNNNMKKCAQHDSGLDLTHNNNNIAGNANNKHEAKNTKSNKKARAHLDSESSSDVDVSKNSMMFEMDM